MSFTTDMNLEKPTQGGANWDEALRANIDVLERGLTVAATTATDVPSGMVVALRSDGQVELYDASSYELGEPFGMSQFHVDSGAGGHFLRMGRVRSMDIWSGHISVGQPVFVDPNSPGFPVNSYENARFAIGWGIADDGIAVMPWTPLQVHSTPPVVSITNPRWNGGARPDGVTDSTTAIFEAVDFANTRSLEVLFPNGVFLTSASIPNLHAVRKRGPGVISRGSDLFHVEPVNGDTNILYVNSAGDDANDGVSSGTARKTLQGGFDALPGYGPFLDGTWRISLAAGSYDVTSAQAIQTGLRSRNRIQVRGPTVTHPGTPTAGLHGGGTAINGIFASTGVGLEVAYLKFHHFTPATGGGIVVQDDADLSTVNVHANSCTIGINQANGGRGRVQGGHLSDCSIGIKMISNPTFTIGQGASSLDEGPIIERMTSAGVLAQEGAMGHVDYTDVSQCPTGIEATVGSRVHLLGSRVESCNIGLLARHASNWFNNETTPNTFVTNSVAWEHRAFSTEVNLHDGFGGGELRVAVDLGDNSHTGDTIKTAVVSPYTIPANTLTDPGRKIRVRVSGSKTNGGTPAAALIGVDIAGSTAEQLTTTGTSADDFVAEFELFANGTNAQRIRAWLMQAGQVVRANYRDRTFIMTSDRALTVTVQLGDAGDTVTIRTVEVWATP